MCFAPAEARKRILFCLHGGLCWLNDGGCASVWPRILRALHAVLGDSAFGNRSYMSIMPLVLGSRTELKNKKTFEAQNRTMPSQTFGPLALLPSGLLSPLARSTFWPLGPVDVGPLALLVGVLTGPEVQHLLLR